MTTKTTEMKVSLELTTEYELVKLLVDLEDLGIDFSLIKAELKKSGKMQTILILRDSKALVNVLKLDGVEFSLVRAETTESPASDISEFIKKLLSTPRDSSPLPLYPPPGYNPPVAPWVTQWGQSTADPLPEPHITVCETSEDIKWSDEITTDELDPDFDLSFSGVQLVVNPSSSVIVVGQGCENIHDNFTGRPMTNLSAPSAK